MTEPNFIMTPFKPFSINAAGRLVEFQQPAVMAILNVTPDSFYGESRIAVDTESVAQRAAHAIAQGADIIDIGGCSTRPGYEAPGVEEEIRRVEVAIKAVREVSPEVLVSVDTFRGEVARRAVAAGADIINDVSAMSIDEDMRSAVIDLKVPYILTHPSATAVTPEMSGDELMAVVVKEMAREIEDLTLQGVADIIVDPGFGFGKTVKQNFEILGRLSDLAILGRPLLVGISRKSMLYKPLGLTPETALNATTVANTIALLQGASIVRVHDVAQAVEAVNIIRLASVAD